MLGVKGGDGIIGAIGPIMRGEIKKSGQSAALGLEYDINIMGHWHQGAQSAARDRVEYACLTKFAGGC
jgi:hypothetical protein